MVKRTSAALLPLERITCSILVLRGQRMILDADLAAILGVQTRVLNQAVKRNIERLPEISCSAWHAKKPCIQDHNL